MAIHIRYRARVQGGVIYHPIDALGRLVCSNRLNTWKLGLTAGELIRKFDEKHATSVARLACIHGVRVDEVPSADLDMRLYLGTLELTDEEYRVLADLVEHAGDAEAYAGPYEGQRLVGLALVCFAPILHDFVSPVSRPEKAPEVVDEPEWAVAKRAAKAEFQKAVDDTFAQAAGVS